ncbi:thiamine biosynthetic bifunctional enzyme TH1, chloroplastic isoform X2 [Spinacia oleracea]|uniref:thiamine phosphate synthase n=1 Tax=Spinacia oleracea TaxID=3562 RepID=A0ABM3RD14_SPIOL|nr:thiamine biosynthetic bifunctional enzyme TH1, chloroplastic isoform X2 [Spinacia oleracea]
MLHFRTFPVTPTLGKLCSPRPLKSSNCPRFSMVSRENDDQKMKIPHVMTVAGSDSGAGAGIQADLKACAALGVYCSTVITAVTAQNTVGVQGVNILPEDFVAEQMKSVLSDMEVDVVKTGMLPSVGMVKVLLQSIKEYSVQALVVDPVMVATSGDVLAGSSVLPVFRNVLVKGGDLPASMDAIDVFYDGENVYELSSARISTRNTHGTGCTLASSIAAELAKGLPMLSAVKIAKKFVDAALNYGKDMAIGRGRHGPFDHLLKLKVCRSVAPRAFSPSDLFLYAVTDSGMNEKWGRSITEAVKAAIEGGATIVQLREKNLETREFLEAAKECVSICHSKGVPILINDRVDVALASDADGVHVGQSDMPVSLVRSLLGPEKIIGISCKTPEQAHEAWVNGADYIGSGGVFPTNTKANNRTIGLDGLKEVCLASKLPVVAIGGIGASNAQSVMEVDAPNLEGVAVVSALFNAECVSSATKQLHANLKQAVRTRS